ncbi:MAG TPA: DUF1549 domain-containing protein [Tepidisphaeraceae bacterium]|nr:DUF1549 domain-containing protein [Tepidisphaeraceae bacterium]
MRSAPHLVRERLSQLAVVVAALLAPSARAADPLFETDVLPILTANCLGCHGGLMQKGGLDLRTIPLMLKGGAGGAAVKAGQADGGLLWKSIADDEMPKDKSPLGPADKDTIRRWIAAGLPTVAGRRGAPDPGLPAGRKHAPADVAAAIDRHVDAGLAAANLRPAPRADDAEFLRRAYLDLAGRVPTAQQAAAFIDDTAADKRARLIDALLASPDFGQQFGRTWRDWVAPPELPSDPNGGKQPHAETQALGKWIGDRLTAGDSWDKVARAMIGAEGVIKDQPQVIVLALQGEGGRTTPAGSARGVASLFMGVQLQCAQCHDDPYRTWSQDDFWALAAVFKRAAGDFGRVYETPPPENPPKPKPGEDPKKLEEQQRKREETARAQAIATRGTIEIPKTAFKNTGKIVKARLLDGPAVSPKADEPVRPYFLDWLTAKDNPYFARAFANRAWFYFFNRGIVHPVDDLRELNPPSHPGLLALLAQEFTAGGYDVKHLVRAICNSAAYQRTSRPPADAPADTALAAKFGRMPARVVSADSLYDSLRQVYGDPKLDLRTVDPKDGNTNGESAAVGDAYLEFRRAFCTNEEDQTDFTHGIPQLLVLLNHPRLTRGSAALDAVLGIKPAKGKDKAAAPGTPAVAPDQAVDWLYLSTLSRRPDADERAEALRYVDRATDQPRAYAGLLWTLVNRSEYLMVR